MRTTPAGEARREAIIDATVGLFMDKGYEGTSVREIAEAVGIRKPSLYHHFTSKEQMLSAIHDRYMDLVLDRAASRKREGGSAADLVAGYMEDLMILMRDYRPYVEVFLRERYALEGEVWARARERRRDYEDYILDAVEIGIEAGDFRTDLDPEIVKYGILGVCSWAYQWFDPTGRVTAEDVAKQFTELILRGLKPRD